MAMQCMPKRHAWDEEPDEPSHTGKEDADSAWRAGNPGTVELPVSSISSGAQNDTTVTASAPLLADGPPVPSYTNEAVSSHSGNAGFTDEASLEAQNLSTGASASHGVLQTYQVLAHSVSGFDVIEPGAGHPTPRGCTNDHMA